MILKKLRLFIVLTFFVAISSRAQSIVVDTLFKDKISIRSLAADKNIIWYAADKNRYGSVDLTDLLRSETKVKKDSLDIEFRSLAQTTSDVFIANVGNPVLLYKISKSDPIPKLVYRERHEKVFYDSMQFWNDLEGIAIGDPTENCFSIIITRDSGNSWQKLPCKDLPELTDGEAAFAASNTNIVIKGNNAWIVSGGKQARVFHSPDKGKTWKVYPTPIVQGKSMTGIFTADFYDAQNGIIAGGDYEIQNQDFGNKALTSDGGKTWKLIAQNSGFGYASCIRYIPQSNGNELICVGGTGIWYSSDGAQSWKKLSEAKDLYTFIFIDPKTIIAAGRGVMVRIGLKK